MYKFLNLRKLSQAQLEQFAAAMTNAFPPVINASQAIKVYWDRMESYFPEYQLFLVDTDGELIGFINTVPFHFNHPLIDLPDGGWDWMLEKSVLDYEANRPPNYLGALQVIVREGYQNQGYSKVILTQAKRFVEVSNFKNLIIPIRPTLKHLHPNLSMDEYMNMKEEEKIYDPWIRTHINGGAAIIKVCTQSMTVTGDLIFWEDILDRQLAESGEYILKGALCPVAIDVDTNNGEYVEPNIWIKYG